MKSDMQTWLALALVLLALLYSVWYALPTVWRKRLGRVHRALGQAPGCNSQCASCGKCSASPAQPSRASQTPECKPIFILRR